MIVRYDEDYDFDDDLASYSAFCYEQEVEMAYASREAELYIDTPACYEANLVTCPWKMTAFCDRYGVYHCMCHCDDGSPEGAWYGPVIKDWEDEVEEFEYWQGEQEELGLAIWPIQEVEYDFWYYFDRDRQQEERNWSEGIARWVEQEYGSFKRARRRHSTEAAKNRLKKLGWRCEVDEEATKWEEISVRRKTIKALRDRHFYEHKDISANTRLKYNKGGMTDQQAIDESVDGDFTDDYESRFRWMEYSPAKRRRVTKVMRRQRLRKRLRGLKQYRSLLTLQHCFGDDHDCVLDNYRRNVRKIVTVSAKISRD